MMLSKECNTNVGVCFLDASDFKSAVTEVINKSGACKGMEEKVFNSVMEREAMQSTLFSDEFILPRAEVETGNIFLAAGISRKGVTVLEGDVKIILLILYPKEKRGDYLSLLAGLYRMISSKQFKGRLLSCEKEEDAKQQIVKGLQESDY